MGRTGKLPCPHPLIRSSVNPLTDARRRTTYNHCTRRNMAALGVPDDGFTRLVELYHAAPVSAQRGEQ